MSSSVTPAMRASRRRSPPRCRWPPGWRGRTGALAQDPGLLDGTLQAFFDTILPGRKVDVTELGNPIHPLAIAGVDPEPGAVEADALLLAHNPLIGFDALAPPLIADLEARSLAAGGQFLDLDYDARERVCVAGLAFSNPDRAVWEAGAAVPFTAFCAAGNIVDATRANSVGYQVMGHPGTAPKGYKRLLLPPPAQPRTARSADTSP